MSELDELLLSARALLEWEAELGGEGLPQLDSVPRTVAVSTLTTPRAMSVPATTQPATTQRAASASATPPPAPPADPLARLPLIEKSAATCTACVLHEGRTKSVFARGTPATDLMFIGEGPGYHEDQRGLPFVGRAGELLDKMIAAMGYGRDEVYICNVVKCRPPENRTPQADEAEACKQYLVGQIAAVQPKAIVALGRCAAENLGLCTAETKGWRGRWGAYDGIPAIPTYHPAFLLRKPEMKRPVWEDLQKVLAKLGRELPRR